MSFYSQCSGKIKKENGDAYSSKWMATQGRFLLLRILIVAFIRLLGWSISYALFVAWEPASTDNDCLTLETWAQTSRVFQGFAPNSSRLLSRFDEPMAPRALKLFAMSRNVAAVFFVSFTEDEQTLRIRYLQCCIQQVHCFSLTY